MMISGFGGTQFSSMISDSNVVYWRWGFLRQPWNWVLVMISGSGGIQFSSMISDSDEVYGR